MTVTTLDPRTALVVIDLQTGVVALPSAEPVDEITERAGELADAFRAHRLPVVLVNVIGTLATRNERNPTGAPARIPDAMTAFVDDLGQQPTDHVVSKQTWGAFTGTGLEQHLRDLGVTQVVLAGIATSIGVESTGRHAQEHGFHVTFAVDAMTDTHTEAHRHSVTRIFPRIGETGTTAEIVDLLARTLP